jgi:hypothetical protein
MLWKWFGVRTANSDTQANFASAGRKMVFAMTEKGKTMDKLAFVILLSAALVFVSVIANDK